VLVDSVAAALHVRRAYGVVVKPGTIRLWAARGHIQRHTGTRYHFDLWDIEEYLRTRGLIR